MKGRQNMLMLFDEPLRSKIEKHTADNTEELRLRLGRNISALTANAETEIENTTVDEELLRRILERSTASSVHTAMRGICEGYISCKGLRIGVCGTAVKNGDQTTAVNNYSSISIRIPHEHIGALDETFTRLVPFESTLIISPPGWGKTSALRELIRLLSEFGYRVAVVDDRNEIAAKDGAREQFVLGVHTDVITGFEKAEGIILLLRAMNPQIIALDELAKEKDINAALDAVGCGASLLAAVHAESFETLKKNPAYSALINCGEFKNIVRIEKYSHERRYIYERIST